MAVQTLVIRVGSEISQALSGLNAVSTRTIKLGRDMKRTGAMLTRNLTAPLVGAGAAAVGAAVRAGNMADALLDLEQQTGLSTDTLQEYRRVTAVAGIETDALATAAQKLNTRIKATGDESLETRNAFALLGVDTRDAEGNLRSMDQLMPEIIGKLGAMENVTERNTLATQIFGRGATDMLPVLGLTADEFERAREEAHEMGLVLEGDTLRSANEFRKKWDTLKQSLGAVATEIGVAVIPHVEGMVTAFQNKVLPVGRKVVKWVQELDPTLVKASIAFAAVAASIGPIISIGGGLIAILGAILSPVGAVAVALGTVAFIATVVVKNWDVLKVRTTLVWAAVKDAVFRAVDGILGGLERLVGFVPVLGDKVRDLREGFNRFADESLARSGRRLGELEAQLAAGAGGATELASSLAEVREELEDPPGGGTAPFADRMLTDVNRALDKLGSLRERVADLRFELSVPQEPTAVVRLRTELADALREIEFLEGALLRIGEIKPPKIERTEPFSTRGHEDRVPGDDTGLLPGFANLPKELKPIETGLDNVKSKGIDAMETLQAAANSAVTNGIDALVDGLFGAGQSFAEFAATAVRELTKVIVKLLIVKALSTFLPGIGAIAGGGGILGLANGGLVARNRPRLVGERGPELFIPSSSGRVVNNRDTMALAGGGHADLISAIGSRQRPVTPQGLANDAFWAEAFTELFRRNSVRAG